MTQSCGTGRPLAKPLRGVIPPMVTPLSGPQSLDVPGLERLIEHVLAGGVHGLFVLGSTAMNRLLGREPKSHLLMSGTVGAEFETNTVAEISRQALARRPDRQLAALGIDRAGAEIKLAKAQKWEDWTLGFGYSRERSIFQDNGVYHTVIIRQTDGWRDREALS